MARTALKKRKLGVLMGGTSSERAVSLKSGDAIYKALKSLHYNVVTVDARNDLCAVLRRKRIEYAFVALHGGFGENGAVQGLLEILGIPYTGSGILASALAMDKEASKRIFIQYGIPVPPHKMIHRSAFITSGVETLSGFEPRTGFAMPWVVKPASEGSSVGVAIVRGKRHLKKALKEAFRYNERIIIERYISGKEIHIGILNNTVLGGVEVKPSLEFYSYEAKYTSGLTEYILPPGLDTKTYSRAKRLALASHKALGCSGATRVDLMVNSRGNIYVLEVNTIPGMTETSLLPKIAKQAGIDFPNLIEKILGGAFDGR
jgi:D-alanine-D-alanine ligase